MSAEVENNDAPNDEPHSPPINIDKLADTVQPDDTPAPTTPTYMGQTDIGSDNMQPTYTATAPRRPIGVTVIAVVNFIGAALFLLVFVSALFQGREGDFSLYIVPFQIAFTILVGVGLLQLKPWGRIIALIGYGLNIILDFISLFSAQITPGTFINLVIAAIVIWYLIRPQVAESFQ